jgi:L-seryl-tRNA(Ser) seleniumtransferase
MERENPFRMLPKVDDVLMRANVAPLIERVGRELCLQFVQDLLAEWRIEIGDGQLDAVGIAARLAEDHGPGGLVPELEARVAREAGRGVVPAVNVAGVVLHTGLGRAPVHPKAAAAMQAAAAGYCVLEVDRFSGQRNRRDDRLSELLARLIGCEAAIAVNNNAAACILAMSTFARGKESILSRGELVEIGGSFRMPEVMEQAGTRLVEVGATNRTRLADYSRAIGPETGLLMKVHRSNFRIEGFTEEVPMDELALLAKTHGLASVYDLGAGFLNSGVPGLTPIQGLEGEPLLSDAIESGCDVVTFSGDKLFGGPQAGLLAGGRGAIEDMRRHPLYRAMRLDKVGLAGLEATVQLYLDGRGDEIPARALMLRSKADLEVEARSLAKDLATLGADWKLTVHADHTQPGSGTAPGIHLDTFCVHAAHRGMPPNELADRLRAGTPPVFTRVADGVVKIDPRTLLPGDRDRLIQAFRQI